MNLQELSKLLTIKDEGTDVTICLGWKTIATIEEEDGMWYLKNYFQIVPECNHPSLTKELAFNALVKWFTDN